MYPSPQPFPFGNHKFASTVEGPRQPSRVAPAPHLATVVLELDLDALSLGPIPWSLVPSPCRAAHPLPPQLSSSGSQTQRVWERQEGQAGLRTFLAGSARLGKVASLLVNARVTPEQTWPPVLTLCPSQLCRFRQRLSLSKPQSPLLQHGDNTTTSGSWES